MIYIIGGCILLFLIIFLTTSIVNSKFSFASIKIEKAEEDINIYLVKKKELLDRTRPIVTKELNIETFLTDLDQDFNVINNFLA